MIQPQFNEWNIMDLITNRVFRLSQELRLLQNLRGYQVFYSIAEYQRLIFPLLQNEYYDSYERERLHRYQHAFEDGKSYPLIYGFEINQEHDVYAERSIRIDLLQELRNMPYIPTRRMWKYQHYTKYLLFKEVRNQIVALYYKNEYTNQVQSILGYYKKNELEQYIQIPLNQRSINFLISVYNLGHQFVNPNRESLTNLLSHMLHVNQLFIQPLGSTTSYQNEAAAVLSISECPFVNLIIAPSNEYNTVDFTQFSEQILQRQHLFFANDIFRNNFDDDQQSAIQNALDYRQKITIIKGPPGTGKTRTILGIIGILADLLRPNNEGIKGSILILAKSNSVVNDLIRKINENINQPQSLINLFQQSPIPLSITRTGRTEKLERDIQPFSLEMKAQLQFFIFRFSAMFDNIYSQCITEELKRLFQIQILQSPHEPLLSQNNECFSLQTLMDFIGTVNSRTTERQILDPLGLYYSRLNELLKNNQEIYKEIEERILNECHIVVTTLNSCSSQSLKKYFEGVKFRMCIVDEAPTALEPSLLIPFVKYQNIEKIVLLGDVEQLNPITISNQSINYGYNKSMFERLSQRLNASIFELRFQYRQIPNLAQITSIMFYNGTLQTGNTIIQYPQYIQQKVIQTRNRLFFNTPRGTEIQFETSRRNNIECQAVIKLVTYLLSDNPQLNKKITIISTYRAQRDYFMECIRELNFVQSVEVDTVDSFQGKENDIIILSLVRSNNQTGFLSDRKRTNVALSRAKYCQFIFGTRSTMNLSRFNWREVLNLLAEQNEIINYDQASLLDPEFYRNTLHNVQM